MLDFSPIGNTWIFSNKGVLIQSAIKDLMLRRNKAQSKDTNIMLETFTKSCKFFLTTLGSSVIGRGSRAAGCMWFPIKWAGSPYFMFMWLLLIQGELVYNISLHHGLGWGYKWAHYDDGYDDNLLGLCVWQYYRSTYMCHDPLLIILKNGLLTAAVPWTAL